MHARSTWIFTPLHFKGIFDLIKFAKLWFGMNNIVKVNVQESWCVLSQYGSNLLHLSKALTNFDISFFCGQNTVTHDEH